MLLIDILAFAGLLALFFWVDHQEGREFKAKFGYSRRDFKHYRKMMTDSSYRKAQDLKKKSSAKTELISRPLNHN